MLQDEGAKLWYQRMNLRNLEKWHRKEETTRKINQWYPVMKRPCINLWSTDFCTGGVGALPAKDHQEKV
jgi:hypothetical protein